MNTFVLTTDLLPQSKELIAAAQKRGWRTEILAQTHRDIAQVPQIVAYYGDIIQSRSIRRKGILHLAEPQWDFLARLPFCYRKRNIEYTSLARARHRNYPLFVKSADPLDRSFDSGVYYCGADIKVRKRGRHDKMPVLISEPVEWHVEYRCFICACQVVDGTPYTRHGRLFRSGEKRWQRPKREWQEVLKLCRRLLGQQQIAVPPAFVLDIGWIAERGWAIIEANPVWSANPYGCRADLVLDTLTRACLL